MAGEKSHRWEQVKSTLGAPWLVTIIGVGTFVAGLFLAPLVDRWFHPKAQLKLTGIAVDVAPPSDFSAQMGLFLINTLDSFQLSKFYDDICKTLGECNWPQAKAVKVLGTREQFISPKSKSLDKSIEALPENDKKILKFAISKSSMALSATSFKANFDRFYPPSGVVNVEVQNPTGITASSIRIIIRAPYQIKSASCDYLENLIPTVSGNSCTLDLNEMAPHATINLALWFGLLTDDEKDPVAVRVMWDGGSAEASLPFVRPPRKDPINSP